MIKEVLAKNIKKLREDKHWTQAELADRLAMSRQIVERWERAKAAPE